MSDYRINVRSEVPNAEEIAGSDSIFGLFNSDFSKITVEQLFHKFLEDDTVANTNITITDLDEETEITFTVAEAIKALSDGLTELDNSKASDIVYIGETRYSVSQIINVIADKLKSNTSFVRNLLLKPDFYGDITDVSDLSILLSNAPEQIRDDFRGDIYKIIYVILNIIKRVKESIPAHSGGGGGGIPAEHDHPVSDIYIPVISGGTYNTTLWDLKSELVESYKNNAEVMEYLENEDITPEDFMERCSYSTNMSPLSDSQGNQFLPFMMTIALAGLKSKISPTSSFYNIQYGTVAKVPSDFDGADISDLAVETSESTISFGIGETMFESVAISDTMELFMLLSGYIPEQQEELDSFLQRFGGKTVVATVQPVDENGDEFDLSEMTFSDFMDDLLSNMFMIQMICFAPMDSLGSMMNATTEQEATSQLKIVFDEIEPLVVAKLPLAEDIAKKIDLINVNAENLENTLRELQNANIDIDRVIKRETIYYGGAKTNWANAFGCSWYSDYVSHFNQSFYDLNRMMTAGYDNQEARMKMGSVFELTFDQQTGEPIYTYIGSAAGQGGLSYTFYTDWDFSDTWSEKTVESLDDYLNESGYLQFGYDNIYENLQEGEYALITVVNQDGQYEGVYCAFRGTEQHSEPLIHIDAVIEEQSTVVTSFISQLIGAAQSAADNAQSAADNAQSRADSAYSRAGAAQSAADNAQSAADNAQSAADNAQSRADSAYSRAGAAQSAADNAQSAADNAQSRADSAYSRAGAAQSAADNAQSAADNAQSAADNAQSAADSAAIGSICKLCYDEPVKNGYLWYCLQHHIPYTDNSDDIFVNSSYPLIESSYSGCKKFHLTFSARGGVSSVETEYGTVLNNQLDTADTFTRSQNDIKVNLHSQSIYAYSKNKYQERMIHWRDNENVYPISEFIPDSINSLRDFVNSEDASIIGEENAGMFTVYTTPSQNGSAYKEVNVVIFIKNSSFPQNQNAFTKFIEILIKTNGLQNCKPVRFASTEDFLLYKSNNVGTFEKISFS